MSLLDDLTNPDNFNIRRGPGCTVCAMAHELPAEEAQAFTLLLANPKVTSASISRVLKKHGHQIGETTIGRHRRGQCRGIDG